jgi:hypothetical protein
MKKDTNWEDIEKQIKILKYPLSFIFKLFKYNKYFTDYDLLLTIRYFLKYHFDVLYEYNIQPLLELLEENKKISKKVIVQFYNSIKKKYIISIFLKKWHNVYNKDNFWNKHIYAQLIQIKNLKEVFLSYFDVSKSRILFHNKILPLLTLQKQSNNNFIINNLINRLRGIYLLFGKKFFEKYKIIIIKKNKFIKININNKIKYCTYIFQKINNIINKIINSFEIFKFTHSQIINIINPVHLTIEINNTTSETDYEDLSFLIEN